MPRLLPCTTLTAWRRTPRRSSPRREEAGGVRCSWRSRCAWAGSAESSSSCVPAVDPRGLAKPDPSAQLAELHRRAPPPGLPPDGGPPHRVPGLRARAPGRPHLPGDAGRTPATSRAANPGGWRTGPSRGGQLPDLVVLAARAVERPPDLLIVVVLPLAGNELSTRPASWFVSDGFLLADRPSVRRQLPAEFVKRHLLVEERTRIAAAGRLRVLALRDWARAEWTLRTGGLATFASRAPERWRWSARARGRAAAARDGAGCGRVRWKAGRSTGTLGRVSSSSKVDRSRRDRATGSADPIGWIMRIAARSLDMALF